MSSTTSPLISLVLAASTLAGTGPAAPKVLGAQLAAIVEVLSSEGYQPVFKAGDDQTAPSITRKVQGDTLSLYFSGCKAGTCARLGTTGFERPEEAGRLAAKLAAWNGQWYSQAYEEQDGTVSLDASYGLKGGFPGEDFLAGFGACLDEYDEFTDLLY